MNLKEIDFDLDDPIHEGKELFWAIRSALELDSFLKPNDVDTIDEIAARVSLWDIHVFDPLRILTPYEVRHAMFPVQAFIRLVKPLDRNTTQREVVVARHANEEETWIQIDFTENLCPVNGRMPIAHRRFKVDVMQDMAGLVSEEKNIMLGMQLANVVISYLRGGRLGGFTSRSVKEMLGAMDLLHERKAA